MSLDAGRRAAGGPWVAGVSVIAFALNIPTSDADRPTIIDSGQCILGSLLLHPTPREFIARFHVGNVYADIIADRVTWLLISLPFCLE